MYTYTHTYTHIDDLAVQQDVDLLVGLASRIIIMITIKIEYKIKLYKKCIIKYITSI